MNKIKKGDNIQVLIGKDKGKTGVVERLVEKTGRIWIAGINISKRHVKKQASREGGIIDILKSVNLSNVMLVCPNCKKATRVGFKQNDDYKIRICKKCKKEIA